MSLNQSDVDAAWATYKGSLGIPVRDYDPSTDHPLEIRTFGRPAQPYKVRDGVDDQGRPTWKDRPAIDYFPVMFRDVVAELGPLAGRTLVVKKAPTWVDHGVIRAEFALA
jgi:hypothetical protein